MSKVRFPAGAGFISSLLCTDRLWGQPSHRSDVRKILALCVRAYAGCEMSSVALLSTHCTVIVVVKLVQVFAPLQRWVFPCDTSQWVELISPYLTAAFIYVDEMKQNKRNENCVGLEKSLTIGQRIQ
jgi:hypothetical protein